MCRGVADYFNLRVFWVRVIMLALFLVSGIWPVVFIYFIASLLMKPEPIRPLETEAEKEFYDSYMSSRARVAGRLKRRFHNLERPHPPHGGHGHRQGVRLGAEISHIKSWNTILLRQ